MYAAHLVTDPAGRWITAFCVLTWLWPPGALPEPRHRVEIRALATGEVVRSVVLERRKRKAERALDGVRSALDVMTAAEFRAHYALADS
jgi:hypothetical protein